MKIWSGLGTLSFEYPRIPPPPPTKHGGDECLETNCCIPQGYRLVLSFLSAVGEGVSADKHFVYQDQ